MTVFQVGIWVERQVANITLDRVVVSDNYVGIAVHPIGRGAKAVAITNSVVIGESGYGGCGSGLNLQYSGDAWTGCQGVRSHDNIARIGIMATTFLEVSKNIGNIRNS